MNADAMRDSFDYDTYRWIIERLSRTNRPLRLKMLVKVVTAIARLTLAGANLLQDFRRKARHLPKQAVRGHAVIAAGDLADEQLDGFLVLLAQGHKLHRDTFVEAA
jgi:hypothetical protein